MAAPAAVAITTAPVAARAAAVRSLTAIEPATRFVAAMERKSRRLAAESEMVAAGPRAARSIDDARPTMPASIKESSEGADDGDAA